MHECCTSFSTGHREMTQRQLSGEEFEKIVEDVHGKKTLVHCQFYQTVNTR